MINCDFERELIWLAATSYWACGAVRKRSEATLCPVDMQAEPKQASLFRFSFGLPKDSEPGLIDPNLPVSGPQPTKIAKPGPGRPGKDAQPDRDA